MFHQRQYNPSPAKANLAKIYKTIGVALEGTSTDAIWILSNDCSGDFIFKKDPILSESQKWSKLEKI